MKAKPSISIDEQLLETIREMAAEQGRTLSNMIEFLLRKAVEDSK